MESKLLFKNECYNIVGACFEVYKEKGCGFLESVYQECLEIEFEYQKIPYIPQFPIQLSYRGKILAQTYKPDFLCYDSIILEIKAVSEISDEHRAQVINYLKATGNRVGYLVNFGSANALEWKRMVLCPFLLSVPLVKISG